MINTNTKIAVHGNNIAAIIGSLSHHICIKIAHMKPALSIIKIKIKLQRRGFMAFF